MSHVVTIYCCGTKFHSDIEGEVVAEAYRDTVGRKWINQGPGNYRHGIVKAEAVMAGRSTDVTARHTTGTVGALVSGQVKGKGALDNIAMSLHWLEEQYWSTTQPPVRVCNLVGWSRGAVTCIELAWAMQRHGLLRNRLGQPVEVNILAFDPVPGQVGNTMFNEFRGDYRRLPSFVSHYWAVLMEDEGKAYLKHVINPPSSAAPGAWRQTFPLPGAHGDCVRLAKGPAAHIGRHLCHRFLLGMGTQLTHPRLLPPTQLVELYSELRLNLIEKKKQPVGGQPRQVNSTRGTIVPNSQRAHPYFINEHHLEVFTALFPDFADKIRKAEETPGDGVVSVLPENMVRDLSRRAPLTALALRKAKLLRLCAEEEDRLTGSETDSCRIEVSVSGDEAMAVKVALQQALQRAPGGGSAGRVWTLEEWKSASKVLIGGRKDQVARIDELLPIYHRLATGNPPAALRILLLIGKQVVSHLVEKPTSDRRQAMAQLGRQVVAKL